MKTYKQKTIPASTIKVLDKKTCDMCGAETNCENQWPDEMGRCNCFNISETRLELRTGKSFVEGGGYGELTSIDICPKCFREKLIPWLQSQGVNVKEHDWDI